ncbi:hypothetical protein AALB52_17820 [Lachnospiraceae bacterium 38-14]
MKKRLLLLLTLILCFSVTACTSRGGQTETQSLAQSDAESRPEKTVQEDAGSRPEKTAQETEGTEIYRDFRVDNVFHSDSEGDIHYNIYIPETYDGTKPYALYFTLPGYGGLYFQGVAANIKTEEFGFEAMKYNEEMIIVATLSHKTLRAASLQGQVGVIFFPAFSKTVSAVSRLKYSSNV